MWERQRNIHWGSFIHECCSFSEILFHCSRGVFYSNLSVSSEELTQTSVSHQGLKSNVGILVNTPEQITGGFSNWGLKKYSKPYLRHPLMVMLLLSTVSGSCPYSLGFILALVYVIRPTALVIIIQSLQHYNSMDAFCF